MALNKNAQKWVNALRSGKYQQTKGHLRDDRGYCCLGVACEIYREETGEGDWAKVGEFAAHKFTTGAYEDSYTSLPSRVCTWLGLRSVAGDFLGPRFANRGNLANVNDAGHSFEEIADLIESQPPDLFAPTGSETS